MKWYEHIDARLQKRFLGAVPGLMIRMPDDALYLERHYVIPHNTKFNIYYHILSHSDEERCLHDHRANNVSIILHGNYWEHIKGKRLWRKPGDVIFRRAETPHRLELPEIHGNPVPCRSLFIKTQDFRGWGFHTSSGWVHHRDFEETVNGVSKAKM